jgi:hypothetical protein
MYNLSAGQKITKFLVGTGSSLAYCLHKMPSLAPIQSQFNPLHTVTPCFYKYILIFPPVLTRVSHGVYLLEVSGLIVIYISYSSLRATCPTHLSLIYLIIIIILLQTGRPGFDPLQRQINLPLACVQTSSEDHPASYPMGTEDSFPGVKRGRGMTLTTHPHLVPRSRMSRSYIFSLPWRLHGGRGTAFPFTQIILM